MHPTAEPAASAHASTAHADPTTGERGRMHPRVDRPASTLPPMVAIQAFRTPVRGYAFASPPPGGDRPVSGLPAELAREPDNPADPLAVAVWASPANGARWRLGYLDRGVAARVAPRLDAGRRVRAQLDGWSTEPEGRWRRPLLLLLPDDEDEAVGGAEPEQRSELGSSSEAPTLAPARRPRPEPARTVDDTPVTNVNAIDDVPRIWGRPPGVRRRRVS